MTVREKRPGFLRLVKFSTEHRITIIIIIENWIKLKIENWWRGSDDGDSMLASHA